MDDARDRAGHGGPKDPEARLGPRRTALRRMAALAVGIVVLIFVVLLVIWLAGRATADVRGPASDASGVVRAGDPVVEETGPLP
ncbi:hypothetical protein [Blastococcus sp. SYSU DS0617]